MSSLQKGRSRILEVSFQIYTYYIELKVIHIKNLYNVLEGELGTGQMEKDELREKIL